MKLSPDAKLNIIFWGITIPVIPFVLLLVTLALILGCIPKFRIYVFDGVEHLVKKFSIWRNSLPIVKNAYDKAHLFDYIKDSKG